MTETPKIRHRLSSEQEEHEAMDMIKTQLLDDISIGIAINNALISYRVYSDLRNKYPTFKEFVSKITKKRKIMKSRLQSFYYQYLNGPLDQGLD